MKHLFEVPGEGSNISKKEAEGGGAVLKGEAESEHSSVHISALGLNEWIVQPISDSLCDKLKDNKKWMSFVSIGMPISRHCQWIPWALSQIISSAK